MGVLHLLAEDAARELSIKLKEGIAIGFRIRRVSSADLAVHGQGMLLAMLKPGDLDSLSELTEEQGRALLLERFSGLSAVQLTKTANSQDALVCAGVTHTREEIEGSPPGGWEPCSIGRHENDPDQGRINVNQLPGPMKKELAEAIQEHSLDMGGLGESIANFRPRIAAVD